MLSYAIVHLFDLTFIFSVIKIQYSGCTDICLARVPNIYLA